MPFIGRQPRSTPIKTVPAGERVVSRTELAKTDTSELGEMFVRVAMLTCLRTRGFNEQTFSSLNQALSHADNELKYVARVAGSLLVAHEWMLLPIDTVANDYNLEEDYAIQHDDRSSTLKAYVSHLLPAGHLLTARVKNVPHRRLNHYERAEVREKLTEDGYLDNVPATGLPKLSDMRGSQFVRSSVSNRNVLVDIEPRFW